MKVLRSLLFIIRLLWVSPLLLPFYLTTEKEMILADVKRWVEVLSQPNRNLLMQLLRQKELRVWTLKPLKNTEQKQDFYVLTNIQS